MGLTGAPDSAKARMVARVRRVRCVTSARAVFTRCALEGSVSGPRVEHYADFGSGEPWVARSFLQLNDLVDAVPAFAGTRTAFKLALAEVFETLGMAFQSLRALRRLVEEGAPELEKEEAYARLYGFLWAAYKDRFQKALEELGYDFGFFWSKATTFEQGASELVAERPELASVVDLLRRYRADFHTPLAEYRNDYLEHRKPPDPRMLESFHQLDAAEETFDDVWRAIEAIVAGIVVAGLPPSLVLLEIPPEKRNPARPERFQVGIRT
jgi:hypothetical protein